MCFALHEGEFVHSYERFCSERRVISNIKTPNLRERILRRRWGDRRGEAAQNGHADAMGYSSCTTRMQFKEDKKKKSLRQRIGGDVKSILQLYLGCKINVKIYFVTD